MVPAPPPPPEETPAGPSPVRKRKKKKKIVFVNPLNPNRPKPKKKSRPPGGGDRSPSPQKSPKKSAAASLSTDAESSAVFTVRKSVLPFGPFGAGGRKLSHDPNTDMNNVDEDEENEAPFPSPKEKEERLRKAQEKKAAAKAAAAEEKKAAAEEKKNLKERKKEIAKQDKENKRKEKLHRSNSPKRGGIVGRIKGIVRGRSKVGKDGQTSMEFQKDYDPHNPSADDMPARPGGGGGGGTGSLLDPDIMAKVQEADEMGDEEDDQFDEEAIGRKPHLHHQTNRKNHRHQSDNNQDKDKHTEQAESNKIDSSFDLDTSERESSTNVTGPISLILLLVDPDTLRFELLQLEFDTPQEATVKDVLTQIAASVTEPTLKELTFVGVMDRLGRSFSDNNPLGLALTKRKSSKDILVVMSKGIDAEHCGRLARPILGDEKVIGMLTLHGYSVSGWAKDKSSQSKVEDYQRKTRTDNSRQLMIYAVLATIAFLFMLFLYTTVCGWFQGKPAVVDPPPVTEDLFNETTITTNATTMLDVQQLQQEPLPNEGAAASMESAACSPPPILSVGDSLGSEAVPMELLHEAFAGVTETSNLSTCDKRIGEDTASALEMEETELSMTTRMEDTGDSTVMPMDAVLRENWRRAKAAEPADLGEGDLAQEQLQPKPDSPADSNAPKGSMLTPEQQLILQLWRQSQVTRTSNLIAKQVVELAQERQQQQLQLRAEENLRQAQAADLVAEKDQEQQAVLDDDWHPPMAARPSDLVDHESQQQQAGPEEDWGELQTDKPDELVSQEDGELDRGDTSIDHIAIARPAGEEDPEWVAQTIQYLRMFAKEVNEWDTYLPAWATFGSSGPEADNATQGWVSWLIFGSNDANNDSDMQDAESQEQGWISYLIFGSNKDEGGVKDGEPQQQGWISWLIFGSNEDNGDDDKTTQEAEGEPKKQGWISYLIFGTPKKEEPKRQGWISYFLFGTPKNTDEESLDAAEPKKQGWISYIFSTGYKVMSTGSKLIFGSQESKDAVATQEQQDVPRATGENGFITEKGAEPKKQGWISWLIFGSNEKEQDAETLPTGDDGSITEQTAAPKKQGWISWLIFGSKDKAKQEKKQGWISWLIFGPPKKKVEKKKQGWISWLIFGAPKDPERGRTWWDLFKLIF